MHSFVMCGKLQAHIHRYIGHECVITKALSWGVGMENEKLKVIFINYGPYNGCCGVHIHFLANALVELGHECHVFLPAVEGATKYFGTPLYSLYAFPQLRDLPTEFFDESVLHVWTTRETVRVPTAFLRKRNKRPYLVHLEDNEVFIAAKELGAETLEEQKNIVKENPQLLENYIQTNPLHFKAFMRSSSGVTCIIKKLEEFVPEDVPTMTFWPACEEDFFRIPLERDFAARHACDMGDDLFVLVYPGAIHEFTGEKFVQLLLAVDQLHKEGFSIQILRAGIENYAYDEAALELYGKYVVWLGDVAAHQLPPFVALADFLVQPGSPGDFDDYRFPSKAPYFLASGRPVILPNCNVAEKLQHGSDCFLMKEGSCEEIAKYLKMLMLHPPLAKSMGQKGRATARALFSWQKSAKALVPFYRQALEKHDS